MVSGPSIFALKDFFVEQFVSIDHFEKFVLVVEHMPVSFMVLSFQDGIPKGIFVVTEGS